VKKYLKPAIVRVGPEDEIENMSEADIFFE